MKFITIYGYTVGVFAFIISNMKKLGAFIVPTGIGASIGGFAGDASVYASKIAEYATLIVNPNVVNAGCFSGITPNMLYVEGYAIDEFFKGNLTLAPKKNNRIGVIFDKGIPKNVLNVHINTINAVKTVYGVDITEYAITDEEAGIYFENKGNYSTGGIDNPETLIRCAKQLITNGAEAIAVVCRFEEDNSTDYAEGVGVDPIGGVEAIISHYITRELRVPCAHSPAFDDITISTDIVDPRCSAEYITPTFLPCILLGLQNAPAINTKDGFRIKDLDFLLMPHNSLGSIPVFEAQKHNIPVYSVLENNTLLNVTNDRINGKCGIVYTYEEFLEGLQ